MQRVQARGTHRDERITAARLDGDATRVLELGDSARAVEEASGAAASERGGRPGGDVDTADSVVIVLSSEFRVYYSQGTGKPAGIALQAAPREY